MKLIISIPEYAYFVLKRFALSTGRSIEEVSSALLISCSKNIKDKGYVKL